MSRGGSRPGAGRKPSAEPTRALTIRATEDIITKVKYLRRNNININAKFAEMINDLTDIKRSE